MTESEQQDETMNCGLSVAERDILYRKLRGLPDTMPPRAVWQRIEEQARAQGLFSGNRHFEKMKWLAGAAVAASVAMLALNLSVFPPEVEDLGPGIVVPDAGPDNQIRPRDLNALKVESQLLERNLRLLPQEPAVMKVSTASTIKELDIALRRLTID